MEKLKNSNIVKALCYFLVPMLVLIIILNACSVLYYLENESDFTNYKSYTETKRFSDNYMGKILRAIHIAESEKEYIQLNSKKKTESVEYGIDSVTLTQIETDGGNPEIQYNFYTIKIMMYY